MKFFVDLIRATFVICGCCLLIQSVANAQSARDRRKDDAPSDRELESRLEKAEQALVDEYKDVAVEFYTQGNKEKAMRMLRRLKQLSPQLDGLDDRIKSINEELMQENLDDFEIDTRKTWTLVGEVAEGKPFRIQTTGDYRITVSLTIGVEGLKPPEESKDFVGGVPLGGLIGVVVTDGKPGKPFAVKSEMEISPKKGGLFFMKVNVPEGTRCSGTLKGKVSGYIKTDSRR